MGSVWDVIEYPTGNYTVMRIGLAVVLAMFILSGCSLHYSQQPDRQDLDVEIMRPIGSNHQPEEQS